MYGWELLSELERLLKMILEYPRGLSVMLGQAPPPTPEELIRAFPAPTRDNMGIKGHFIPEGERFTMATSRIDEIVKDSGGWEHITGSLCEWKHEHPEDWELVADHIRLISAGRSFGGAKLQGIADKYGISPQTVMRKRKVFAECLANYVLFNPINE